MVHKAAAFAGEESSSEDEDEESVARKTRTTATWIHVKAWPSAQFSDALLEAQKTHCAEDGYGWTNKQRYFDTTGRKDEKTYMQCKCAGCPCVLRLIKQAGLVPQYVLQKKHSHEHDMDDMSTALLPQKIKRMLMKWLQIPGSFSKFTIFKDLSEQGIDTVKEFKMIDRGKQVMGFLTRERAKIRKTILATTWGHFTTMATDHVVGHQAMLRMGDHEVVVLPGYVVDQESDQIAITFSTKHLLRNLDRWDLTTLCQDGTFKIVCNGNVLYFITTKDARNQLHIVSASIIRSEKSASIETVLKNTLMAASVVCGTNVARTIEQSMNDNSGAIQKANAMCLKSVEYPGVCLWHLKLAVQANSHKFSSQDICNEFKADIRQIADATVDRLPDVLLEKLLIKYTDSETDAMQWFAREWGGDAHNFSYPMPLGLRANSRAEDCNGQFKRECTHRKVCANDKFMDELKTWLQQRSQNDAEFHTTVELTRKDWDEAQNKSKGNFEGWLDFIYKPEGEHFTIVLSTGNYMALSKDGTQKVTEEDVDSIFDEYACLANNGAEHQRFANYTFDELAKVAKSCRHLCPLTGAELARHGNVGYQCSCVHFWKYGKCYHSMALQMKMGKLTVPRQFVNEHVGEKRKPGRSKVIKPQKRHKKKSKKSKQKKD